MTKNRKVRTRFAPSPTGYLHVGGVRTALYSYAWAKHNDGEFVLRIEDTDRKRYEKEYVDEIYAVLRAYGLDDYGEPLVQSERLEIYQKYAKELIEKGDAYYCFCSPERLDKVRKEAQKRKEQPMYDRKCIGLSDDEVQKRIKKGEKPVIRLKVPRGEELEYEDVVMGKVKFNTDVVDDQVLMKSDGFPTYHLAVVIDDHEMGITHVTRGAEWISSTPKQMLLYKAFGWEAPKFAHLPVFLDPSSGKGKMSKRKGTTAAMGFLADGYLPEAVLNFLMLLGWAPSDDRELFTLAEFVDAFTLDRLNKSNPVFDRQKLTWFNKQYLSKLSDKDFAKRFVGWLDKYCPYAFAEVKSKTKMIENAASLIKDRVSTLADVLPMVNFLFVDEVKPEKEEWKAVKSAKSMGEIKKGLKALLVAFEKSPWKGHEDWEATIRQVADELDWKHGDMFMALRIAVVGSRVSPPLYEAIELLGKEKSLERVKQLAV